MWRPPGKFFCAVVAASCLYAQPAIANPTTDFPALQLGLRYETGDGVAQNYATARQCFEQAAAAGSAEAWLHLGRLYYEGWGVPKDRERALALFTQAAEANVKTAQIMLSEMYGMGVLVPQDLAKALAWAERAAVSDDPTAEVHLGKMIEHGHGTTASIPAARDWYQLAAEQDYTPAMTRMAQTYLQRGATDADRQVAIKWLELALDGGNPRAAYVLAALYVSQNPDDPETNAKAKVLLQQAQDGHVIYANLVLSKYAKGVPLPEAFRYVHSLSPAKVATATQKESRQRFEKANFVPSRILKTINPEIPEILKLQHIEGDIIINYKVSKAGLIKEAKLLSCPHPALGEAYLEALKKSRFIPALKNGERAEHRVHMTYHYTSDKSGLDLTTLPTALPAQFSQ